LRRVAGLLLRIRGLPSARWHSRAQSFLPARNRRRRRNRNREQYSPYGALRRSRKKFRKPIYHGFKFS
jgi:hypothetical protein